MSVKLAYDMKATLTHAGGGRSVLIIDTYIVPVLYDSLWVWLRSAPDISAGAHFGTDFIPVSGTEAQLTFEWEEGATIINATCNGIAGSGGGSLDDFGFQVSGSLEIVLGAGEVGGSARADFEFTNLSCTVDDEPALDVNGEPLDFMYSGWSLPLGVSPTRAAWSINVRATPLFPGAVESKGMISRFVPDLARPEFTSCLDAHDRIVHALGRGGRIYAKKLIVVDLAADQGKSDWTDIAAGRVPVALAYRDGKRRIHVRSSGALVEV